MASAIPTLVDNSLLMYVNSNISRDTNRDIINVIHDAYIYQSKTLKRPPRGTLGILRPQTNVLEISEQVGAPEAYVQGPTAFGYIPTFTNPIHIHGKIESTALWSEVVDQRLMV